MKEVQLPDGTIAEFPDSMSSSQIESALRRQFGQAQESPFIAGGVKGAIGGVLRGGRDIIDAGAQMLVRGANKIGIASDDEVARVDTINREAERDYRQNWRGGQEIGFDAARLLGNIGATAPLVPFGGTATLAGKVGQGAVSGGALGTLQPVDPDKGDFWAQKAGQAQTGALFGGAGAAAGAGLARMIQPKTNPNVQLLLKEGVTPTPGQVLGGGWRRAEEKLSSVPILGSAIRVGQQRADDQLARAAVNRSLFAIGKKLPAGMKGHDAINFVEDALGSAYDDVLARIKTPKVDDEMLSSLANLRGMLRYQPKDLASRLDDVIGNEILGRVQNERMTSEAIKKAESELGRLARGWTRDASADTRVLGEATREAQNILRQWVSRNAGADVAADLRKVNTGWANYLRAERAGMSVAADGGAFSPAQLHNAVKAMSANKRDFGHSRALMQDLSGAAKEVLSSKVPNSGTTDRLLMSVLLGGTAYGGATLTPGMAAAALPGLMYLPGVQRAAAHALTTRPQFAQPLSEAARYLGAPAGVSLGYGLLD